MTDAPIETLEVAGRTFVMQKSTTFAQDFFLMGRLEKAGLTEMIQATVETPEGLSNLSKKMLLHAYSSGELFAIMGGLLVEQGTKWTEAAALANGQFFADLSDPDEKAKLNELIAVVVMGFFVNAASSFEISPNFSEGQKSSPASSESSWDGRTSESESRDHSGAPAISEAGTPSSEPSPDTTLSSTTA